MNSSTNDMAVPSAMVDLANWAEDRGRQFRVDQYAVERADADGAPLMVHRVVPDGVTVQDITQEVERLLPRPRAITDVARLDTADAMAAYIERHRRPQSTLFVDLYSGTWAIEAIVDYHRSSQNGEEEAGSTPAWGRHRAVFLPRLNPRLLDWTAVMGEPMDQTAFSHFLEFRAGDIGNPPVNWMMVEEPVLDRLCAALNIRDDLVPEDHVEGATYDLRTADHRPGDGDTDPYDAIDTQYRPMSRLEKLRRLRFGTAARVGQLTRDLTITRSMGGNSSYDPKTGDRVIDFADESQHSNRRGRKVIVPDLFLLHLPLFEGGRTHYVPVRLYVRGAGAPTFVLIPIDLDTMLRTAVLDEARTIAMQTGLPLYLGRADVGASQAARLREQQSPIRTVDVRKLLKAVD